MEHTLYLTAIKGALRARGLTYAELAGTLRMTESGVKKMLNAKDISFRRILDICDTLDILPGELFASTEQAAIPEIRFTARQEDALLKDRELLAVFWLFTIERKTPEEIAQGQRLTISDVRKLLQRLVTLELVSQRRNRFLPKFPRKFRWPDDAKIARQLNRDWSSLTLRRALEQGSHRLIALRLSPESVDDLSTRLNALFDEFARLSEREEMAPLRLGDLTALFAINRSSVFASEKRLSAV